MSVGFHFQFLENKIKYCIIAFRVFLGRSQYSPQGPNTSSTLLPDSNSHRIPRRSVAKGPTSSQGHIATSQILSCSTSTVNSYYWRAVKSFRRPLLFKSNPTIVLVQSSRKIVFVFETIVIYILESLVVASGRFLEKMEKTIRLPALGRDVRVGDHYNYSTDEILKSNIIIYS